MNTKRRQLTSTEMDARDTFLAALRKKKWSQEQFAGMIGVSPQMVSHWSVGRVPIPAVRAPQIGVMLDESPSAVSAEFAENVAPYIDHLRPSHAARITPEIIANAALVSAELVNAGDAKFDARNPDDAEILARVLDYMLVKGVEELGAADVVKLMREVIESVGVERVGGGAGKKVRNSKGQATEPVIGDGTESKRRSA